MTPGHQRQEIKAAEPTVSNRAIAKMVGADETSIRRDTAVNAALTKQYNNEINDNVTVAAANAAPPAVTGPEAAKAVAGFAQRQPAPRLLSLPQSGMAALLMNAARVPLHAVTAVLERSPALSNPAHAPLLPPSLSGSSLR